MPTNLNDPTIEVPRSFRFGKGQDCDWGAANVDVHLKCLEPQQQRRVFDEARVASSLTQRMGGSGEEGGVDLSVADRGATELRTWMNPKYG